MISRAPAREVQPRELHVDPRHGLPVDGVVELPAHDRLAVGAEHDLARAVVVRERVPRGDVAQPQHPLLVRRAVGERQRARPERQADVDRLDEDPRVGEVPRDERLELPRHGCTSSS